VECLDSLSPDELIQIILDQQRLIEQLRAEIEQLKRRGSAAPFSKGTHKPNPKRAGRKPGQGSFRRRTEPQSAAEQPPVEVPVDVDCCPECGGPLGECWEEIVSTTDMPPQPQPEVRKYAIQVRTCQRCGKSVRGQHPDVAEGQQGATAHRLGPRVKAIAHLLHYGHGVPVRKVPAIIGELTGVQLTQGAITQDAMKQSGQSVGAHYEQLRGSVREQPTVHTDDTGWRVGGDTAFLMAFVNPRLSVYQIRRQHRNEEVRELIPANFAGIMICDRGKSYDAEELNAIAQQKCLAHLIRNAVEVAEAKTGRARQFSQKLKELLKQALTLPEKRTGLELELYQQQVTELDQKITHHLRNRILRDDDNQRLLNGVGTQHDRGHILRFLYQSGIEPTNNRAERDLRPAVISRKVSQCSKNRRGAHAFEAFTSVLETIRKTSPSEIARALVQIMAGQPTLAPP
jgi:transposase